MLLCLLAGADSPSIRTPTHYPSLPPTRNWTLLAFAGLWGRQLHDLPGPLSQAPDWGEEEEGTVSPVRGYRNQNWSFLQCFKVAPSLQVETQNGKEPTQGHSKRGHHRSPNLEPQAKVKPGEFASHFSEFEFPLCCVALGKTLALSELRCPF